MKHMLRRDHGFALPTILIASVIMLIVLMSAVTAVSSITGGINSQYYNQLAREAAESGLANAETCLRVSNYVPSWTDASPLKPDVDCSGAPLGPGYSKYIIETPNVRTTFTVARPTVGTASALHIVSTGTVELLRTSDPNSAWRTYTATVGKNSRYNDLPQIASGAGFQNSGHNGYMLAGSGTLYGWGDNSGTQLGDASLGTTVATPQKLVLPSGVTRAKKVYGSGQGASILCILATHQTLGDQIYCRGNDTFTGGAGWQRFGLTAGLTARSADVHGWGGNAVCVVASDMQAYCAGENVHGSFGTGTTSGAFVPFSAPVRFRLDLANPAPLGGTPLPLTVKTVMTRDNFVCVIASDNQAYCAGENYFGQLGRNTVTINVGSGNSVPGRVLVPGAPVISDVRLTYHGSREGVFVQTANYDVFMSGYNIRGTANDGAFSAPVGSCALRPTEPFNCYPIPRQLTNGTFGKMISIGERGDDSHGFCVIAHGVYADSGLWCIGNNTYGELGLSCAPRSTWISAVPVLASGVSQSVSDTLNREADYQMNSLMVITVNGDVYAAGDNTYGKLGTGGPLQACNSTMTRVGLPSGVKGVAVANNDEYSSYILGDNGKVYAMGRNNNGQLGDGTTTDRNTPVEVKIPRQETVF